MFILLPSAPSQIAKCWKSSSSKVIVLVSGAFRRGLNHEHGAHMNKKLQRGP